MMVVQVSMLTLVVVGERDQSVMTKVFSKKKKIW